MTEFPVDRRRAWAILSDLYLDSDMVPSYTAKRLAELPFDPSELEAILFDEVHPVFFGNILTVAGEWMGWGDENVAAMVSTHLAETASGTHRYSASQEPRGFIARRQWATNRAQYLEGPTSTQGIIRSRWNDVLKELAELRRDEA